ncbi:MAG: hypothetical protein Q9184_003857 [Pyrenodesmia sp. 2 TL-2023]
MQTIPRSYRPTARSFEDGQMSMPLTQQVFPYRRKSASYKKTGSKSPAISWNTQTLTQMVPTLALATSSLDGADDMECDGRTSARPSTKKRRNSVKKSTPGSPPQRNTITQMYSHYDQLYPNRDAEELEEEHIPVVDTPPPRTRRKKSSLTPMASSVQTRSSRKKAAAARTEAKAAEPSNTPSGSASPADRGPDTSIPKNQNPQMLPPATPKRTIKKVIPSSQSPAETPLSNSRKRRRVEGCNDVTPLQERSVNTPSRKRLSSRRKTVTWAPKLEVADSTNTQNENSEDPFPFIIPKDPVENHAEKLSLPSCGSPPKRPSEVVGRSPRDIFDTPETSKFISPASNTVTLKRKGTIADSEDEDTGSTSRSPDRAEINKTLKSYSILPSVGHNDDIALSALPDHHEIDLEETPNSLQEDIPRNNSYQTIPTQPVVQPTLSTSPSHSTTLKHPLVHQPSSRPSDSEEASLQLETELLLSSSPASTPQPKGPYLETESQFENAWREFTPPPPPPHLSSTPAEPDPKPESADSPTLPPLPSAHHTNLSNSSPSFLPAVPPSQATTTDITQPTPHRLPLADQDSQPLASSPLLQRVQTLSSSSGSSPFQNRKEPAAAAAAGETFMGYEGWNGVPMRDSQLLPHSLLDDSLEVPPLLWGEQEEEEEELELELDEG